MFSVLVLIFTGFLSKARSNDPEIGINEKQQTYNNACNAVTSITLILSHLCWMIWQSSWLCARDVAILCFRYTIIVAKTVHKNDFIAVSM